MPRLDHMKGEVSVRNLERKKCPELAHRMSPLVIVHSPKTGVPHSVMQPTMHDLGIARQWT